MTNSQIRQGSTTLMRAELPIATRLVCQQQNPIAYRRGLIDFNNVICTGGPAAVQQLLEQIAAQFGRQGGSGKKRSSQTVQDSGIGTPSPAGRGPVVGPA
jgi:hypothetical protein